MLSFSQQREQNLSVSLPKTEPRNTERVVRNVIRLPQLGRSGAGEVKDDGSNYASLTRRSLAKVSLDSGTASSVNLNYDENNDLA